MITKKDRTLLIDDMKQVFATKDDLGAMEQRQDKKFATKDDLTSLATKDDLKPIKSGIRKINKKLDETITYLEKQANFHHRRLDQLEHKVGVKPPPFVVSVSPSLN